MKRLNFAIAIMFSLALAVLGDLNANDPAKGWIIGIAISSLVTVAMIATGMERSRLLEENGVGVFATFGILYWLVIISPMFIFNGWLSVFISFTVVILWKAIYLTYSKE